MTSTLQQEGGRKLRLSRVAGDAPRPGAVRARLHHLHAYRQRGACRTRRCRPRGRPSPPSTASSTCRRNPSSTRRSRRTPRRRTRRFAPPRPYRSPQAVQGELNAQELALYRLVWQRTLASQMADATGTTVSVRLGATSTHESTDCEFAASGTTITFPGYRAVYVADDDDGDGTTEALLPPLAGGDVVPVESLTPQGHTTSPPARYTEASLVKRLEELGIGRPVHVGLDHPDHPGPRLRVEEGPGAGADLDGVRRRRPARAALRRPRRLRADRQDRGRPRRDRHRQPAEGPVAAPLLLRRRRASSPGSSAWSRRTSTRSTPPPSTPSRSAPTPTATRSSSSPASTGPTSSAATTPPASPTTWRPTS